MTSLNPVFTCGDQIEETIRLHHPEFNQKQIKARALEMLKVVGLPSPEQNYHEYPTNCQAACTNESSSAIAISCSPKLLIADEPTTALDVTIRLRNKANLSKLQLEFQGRDSMITHDLGVVAEMCSDVVVMYVPGKIIENKAWRRYLYRPKHPYTEGFSVPFPFQIHKDWPN